MRAAACWIKSAEARQVHHHLINLNTLSPAPRNYPIHSPPSPCISSAAGSLFEPVRAHQPLDRAAMVNQQRKEALAAVEAALGSSSARKAVTTSFGSDASLDAAAARVQAREAVAALQEVLKADQGMMGCAAAGPPASRCNASPGSRSTALPLAKCALCGCRTAPGGPEEV